MKPLTRMRQLLLVLIIAAGFGMTSPAAFACDEECNEGYIFSDTEETCVPKPKPST